MADLELALVRVERDHVYERVFVSRETEWLVLRHDRTSWLQRIHGLICSGTYVPGAAEVADVPKGGGTVRAGSLLSLEDEVIYTAAVGLCMPAIQRAVTWSVPHPDCSYLLRKPAEAEWLSTSFFCWKGFRERSLAALAPNVNYAVVTDVVSYYDCVLHKELLSDLLEAGVSTGVAQYLVGALLSRWGITNGRGVPQGLSASDLLAKLYLNRVDRVLTERGIQHLRYVDDIRLFAPNAAAARKNLLELQKLLRARGLSLQSSKTNIMLADEARAAFDGIQPVLAPLAAKFVASIALAAGLDAAYLTPGEAADLLSKLETPPTDLLQQAYRAYFMDLPNKKFEKTLFHYLLNRLGQAGDSFAVAHAVGLLIEAPQETAHVLRYIAKTGMVEQVEPQLLKLLSSEEAVYAYQHYQYLRWRARQLVPASSDVLAYARRVVGSARAPHYLVSAARLLLSRYGTSADLDAMQTDYGQAKDELTRLDIVCGVHRMEKTKRNSFLGQVRNDGPLLALAVEAIKNGAYASALESW